MGGHHRIHVHDVSPLRTKSAAQAWKTRGFRHVTRQMNGGADRLPCLLSWASGAPHRLPSPLPSDEVHTMKHPLALALAVALAAVAATPVIAAEKASSSSVKASSVKDQANPFFAESPLPLH